MNVAGFYSDPHFGHKNIVKYCQRPFKDWGDMEVGMVERYNAKVKDTDLIIWVGDCFFYKTEFEARLLLEQMKGHKVLIMGNHDVRNGRSFMVRCGFDAVVDRELFVQIGKRRCRVNHYPYWKVRVKGDWADDRYRNRRPARVKGEVLIHGHTHSPRKQYGNMINVGVDAWDYGPAMMEEVAELVAKV